MTGNTCVVLSSERRPLPAITLAEVLATSDVPGGVVNVLTGRTAEVAPWLASHADVNGIDLAGAAGADGLVWGDLERGRRRQPQAGAAPGRPGCARPSSRTGRATPDPARMRTWLETKTVWHPKGT